MFLWNSTFWVWFIFLKSPIKGSSVTGAQNNSLLKCCYYRISCNQVREAFTTHHRILIPGIRVGTSFTKQEGQVAVRSRVSSVSHFYFPFQPSCYIWEWLDLCTVINSVVISFIRQQSKGGRVPSEPSARPPDFCLSQCLGMTQNSTPCKWPYERMTLLIPNQTLKSWPQLSRGTGRGFLHHQMLDLSGNAGGWTRCFLHAKTDIQERY